VSECHGEVVWVFSSHVSPFVTKKRLRRLAPSQCDTGGHRALAVGRTAWMDSKKWQNGHKRIKNYNTRL